MVRLGWRLFHLSFIPERILLWGCNAVVAVSETTAREIRKNRLTKKPISVVHNAPERSIVRLERETPAKSLVYMGSFMPYKNVETLIRGVGKLTGYRLELLSRIDPNRRSVLQALADEVGAKVKFHDGVTDVEYHQLLSKATALVSASLDEGFGIPLVEAMELGVPVVVSDIEIFREIAESVGVYFDPKNPDALATAVKQVAKSPIEQKSLVSQAAKFNWDESAESLLAAITAL